MSDTGTRMVPPNSGTLELHYYQGNKVFYLNPAYLERFWVDEQLGHTNLRIHGDTANLKVVETPEQIIQMIIDAGVVP